jgi:hypothetical protein
MSSVHPNLHIHSEEVLFDFGDGLFEVFNFIDVIQPFRFIFSLLLHFRKFSSDIVILVNQQLDLLSPIVQFFCLFLAA